MKKILLIIVTLFVTFNIHVYAKENDEDFDLYSKYALVYNATLGKVMYEFNSNVETKVASMTKIMTAIIVIENNEDLNKIITIKDEDLRDMYEYATAGFQAGQEVSIKELLYGILLPSGSDAVNAAVRVTTDNEDEFVELMNKKVSELGLTNTNFSNPIGKDDGNYSTAYDIAKIMEYCLKNETFKEIISTDMYYIDRYDIQINGPLYKMDNKYDMDLSIIKGGKNGYTYLARYSLVSYGEKDGIELIVVSNGANNFKEVFTDTTKLYNYYFDNYGYKNYDINFKLDVKNSKQDKYEVNINSKLYLKNDYDKNLLSYKYEGIDTINKLKKNSNLGNVYIYYDGKLIKEENIKLSKEIKYKGNSHLILFIVLCVLVILLVFKYSKKLKKVKVKAKHTVKPEVIPQVDNRVNAFIKEENSISKKLHILKTTIDVNLFFETLRNVNYTSNDKEKFEHDFIDRCFESIDFKCLDELRDLYTRFKLYNNEMCSNTIKYYNKLFKYCIEQYIK